MESGRPESDTVCRRCRGAGVTFPAVLDAAEAGRDLALPPSKALPSEPLPALGHRSLAGGPRAPPASAARPSDPPQMRPTMPIL